MSRCFTASALMWYYRDRSRQRRHSKNVDQHTQTHFFVDDQCLAVCRPAQKIIHVEFNDGRSRLAGALTSKRTTREDILLTAEENDLKTSSGMHKRNAKDKPTQHAPCRTHASELMTTSVTPGRKTNTPQHNGWPTTSHPTGNTPPNPRTQTENNSTSE